MLRVLLVEDYPATARLIQTLLERGEPREFTVEIASSLAGVSRLLLRGGDPFDVVLLDLGLPDSSGVETLDQMLALDPGVPVIVLTGLDDESVALKAVQHGAQDFLIKGEFDSGQLKRSVRYAVERKRVFSELGESGALLDGVLSSARDAVMALEAVRSDSGAVVDFLWRLANPACERVLGRHARELMGQTLLEQIPSARERGFFDGLVAVVEKSITLDIEWSFEESGHQSWLHVVAVKLRDGCAVTVADVTDRIRSIRAIQAREERLRMIMQTVVDGIITIDVNGLIESFNPAAGTIFGYEADEVLGRPVNMLMPEPHRSRHGDYLRHYLGGGPAKVVGRGSAELEGVRKDGSLFPLDLAVSEMVLSDKRLFIGVVRDITERKQNEQRLRFLASRDPLTGLSNRSLFRERLDLITRHTDGPPRSIGLLFIDLDRFKNINDTLGYQAGDHVLWEAARRLERCVREGDTVARLSGDEFTILIENVRSPEAVAATAREVLEQLATPYDIDGREVYISACVGCAMYPDHADDPSNLLKRVDTALNESKRKGSGNFTFYTDALSAHMERHLRIESGLRRALERKELELLFQPKVDLATERVVGSEALLRWHSNDLGSVSPVEFIPIAEETGLIIPIGEWVLREACLQVGRWAKAGLPPMRVAVNLSARQFRDSALISRVQEIISETGMVAELLELELTESMLVESATDAISALWALKGLGITLSIDDFGTGYSSLSYLKKFPIDALKIDQSFVRDIPTNSDDVAIVKAIVSLAKSLGLKIVAEGLETIEQIRFMRGLECEQGQGYYYSRPITPADFMELFKKLDAAANEKTDNGPAGKTPPGRGWLVVK
ncbi:MAG: EAL domain-containing protein [Alphaproteobacteria bacterium]|nr:EAL domain-containing protein [Alphaproteobacteria bacterium]